MSEQYYYNKRINNAPIRRRLDQRFVRWVVISACIGTVIASGFVYSAKCHFDAVALGYETQQQRAALDQQAERRRQLELERARALAPEELEARARRVGLRTPEPVVETPPAGETAANRTEPARPATRPATIDAPTVRVTDQTAGARRDVARPAADVVSSEPAHTRKTTE